MTVKNNEFRSLSNDISFRKAENSGRNIQMEQPEIILEEALKIFNKLTSTCTVSFGLIKMIELKLLGNENGKISATM